MVVDVISDPSEDFLFGQTLRRPLSTDQISEIQKHGRQSLEDEKFQEFVFKDILNQSNFFFLNLFHLYEKFNFYISYNWPSMKNMSSYLSVRSAGSCLTLEVISGPSLGLRCSVQSTNTSRLPLTLGRVSPSDLLLKDSEVSGKHAMINWNSNVNLHDNYYHVVSTLLL